MKKALSAVFALLATAVLNAAPFGLKMGMTMDEVLVASNGTPLKPAPERKDAYSFVPAKPHPLFSRYYVLIDNKVGLYGIIAIGDELELDDYGTQIKDAFNNATTRVSKTYGNPLITDTIEPDTLLKDERYWSDAFHDGARKLSATWPYNANGTLGDNLLRIMITAVSTGYQTGCVVLTYSFTNAVTVQDEEDDVF